MIFVGTRLTQEGNPSSQSKRLLSEIKSANLRIDLLKEGGDDGHHPATTIPLGSKSIGFKDKSFSRGRG